MKIDDINMTFGIVLVLLSLSVSILLIFVLYVCCKIWRKRQRKRATQLIVTGTETNPSEKLGFELELLEGKPEDAFQERFPMPALVGDAVQGNQYNSGGGHED